MNNETEQDINQLSVYEQNMQYIGQQRQKFQAQLLETESAMNEIGDKKTAYKIIGNIMVKTDSEKLIEDLKSKMDILNVRIESIKKQEETVRKKIEELQKKVMKKLDDKKQG